MKFFFALAAATIAVANAASCDLGKLAPLLSDVDVVKCKSDTGLNPPVPAGADVLPKLCDNKACLSALAKLKALNVGDCTIGSVALETDFLKPIESYCAKPTPATSPSPAAGTPTTGTPSVNPTPSTAKPVC